MFKKSPTYLSRNDENFEVALEAMQHLRKHFLTVPFEEFVNSEKLRQSLPENKELRRYLINLGSRLNFGTDSYRYFMQYLSDAKTAEVADEYASQRIHTDFRGRCEINNADTALGYAMGFNCLDDDLDVEKLGYETDFGYIEETISTELGDVVISGHKNAKGNYHGYCQIMQADGSNQKCFFNDGKILARRIYYTNGAGEDIRDNDNIAVDPFAQRTVYNVVESADNDLHIEKISVERAMAEEIFNTLSGYSLEMECVHAKRYPYDDDTYYETEHAKCVPALNMALFMGGKLIGVVLKTNEYDILPLDCEKYSLRNRWETYVVSFDDEFKEGPLKITLRKRG